MARDRLLEMRTGLKRLAREHPAAAGHVDTLLELTSELRAELTNARRRTRRASTPSGPMRQGDPRGQGGEILELLRRRGEAGATVAELVKISPNYTGRISDLRQLGHDIVHTSGCYVLAGCAHARAEGQLPFPSTLRIAATG